MAHKVSESAPNAESLYSPVKAKQPSAPWNKYLLLVLFSLILSLTCSYWLNGNGAKLWWRKAHIPCDPHTCPLRTPAAESVATSDAAPLPGDPLNGSPNTASSNTPKEEGKTSEITASSDSPKEEGKTSEITASSNTPKEEGKTSEICSHGDALRARWLLYFQSSEMLAAYAGVILDTMGPKFTFTLGQLQLASSLVIGLLGYMSYSMLLAGSTTPLLMNSTMCIANLFPASKNFIMAILSSACDAAQFVLPFTYSISQQYPALTYTTLFYILISASLFGAVASVIFLPMKPFEVADTTKEETPLLDDKHGSLVTGNFEEDVVAQGGSKYMALGVWGQACSAPLLLFSVYWFSVVIRMNAYLNYNEAALRQFGDDGSMAQYFGYIFPFSFIPCIFIGVIADAKGVMFACSLINVLGCIVNGLSMVPVLEMQWVSVGIFTIVKSSVFTMMFSFVAEIFGFRYFGTLTVLLTFLGGMANWAVGEALIVGIDRYLGGNYVNLNLMFLVVGIVTQCLVFVLSRLCQPEKQFAEHMVDALSRRRVTQVYGYMDSSRTAVMTAARDGDKDVKKMAALACSTSSHV